MTASPGLVCYDYDGGFWYAAVHDTWRDTITERIFDSEDDARRWLYYECIGRRYIQHKAIHYVHHLQRVDGLPKGENKLHGLPHGYRP